ncbi:MAG: UDP-N-acetylglucosamine 2-epimerase (non-hydrolyzing) [Anaerolineaceae bacterium]|nr:UDP-N-acetylglucosamine 2-epimerase (non-hydrolyzing) [Anaerolineaceae bacterium]
MRVLTIFGTRPEAVKLCPVVQELKRRSSIDSRVCVTAQHREMLDQVLSIFDVTPDIDLNLMRPNQALADITARILLDLNPVLEAEKPDWIIVQGDTTTVMAAALLGYYQKIKVGHVEAGLRTYNRWQPFPEEINRKIAGIVADLHFAPTEHSRQNLLKEGIPDWRIKVTGNPVIDALNQIAKQPMPEKIKKLLSEIGVLDGQKKLVAVTAHRRENFGEPLRKICNAIRKLADDYGDQIHLVYPVHLNPNVQETVYPLLKDHPSITLLPPATYDEMIALEKNATMMLTDSGGIQEEVTTFGIPTLVLRHKTERPEGVSAGFLHLVGDDEQLIYDTAVKLLQDKEGLNDLKSLDNPFGDGHASRHIVDALLQFTDQESDMQENGRNP